MQYLQIKCFRRRFIARQYFLIINFSSGRNWIPIRYVEYEFEKGLYPPKPSFEQTNIFILSCAACVVASIVFSKGAPYRKHLFTNGNYTTKRTSFNYFPLSLSTHIVIVTYHFCCCQYQLLSSTFNFLFTTLNTQDNIHSIRRNAPKQWDIIFAFVSIQHFVTKT